MRGAGCCGDTPFGWGGGKKQAVQIRLCGGGFFGVSRGHCGIYGRKRRGDRLCVRRGHADRHGERRGGEDARGDRDCGGESVSLDFWWTGSAYKTKIDGTEYAVNASFGEDVTAKASLKTTGTGVSLSGVRDGGIRSQAHVVNSSATLTDLGDGLYNIKGNVNDSMLVQMDPVAVTDGSIVRISLAMHGAGAADDNDTWLSLMLGTDIRNGQYGPNETTYSSSGRRAARRAADAIFQRRALHGEHL